VVVGDGDAYRQIHVTNKETHRAPAWLWLPPGPFESR
jgi:hypothetical protein